MKSSTPQTVQKYDSKRWLVPMNERVTTNDEGVAEYEYDDVLVEADNAADAAIKAQKSVIQTELDERKEAFFNELLEANMHLASAKAYKECESRYDSIGKVVNPDEGEYINPIRYTQGMAVVQGKWYTDGDDIWEALKDGVPASFSDKEYFDIVS